MDGSSAGLGGQGESGAENYLQQATVKAEPKVASPEAGNMDPKQEWVFAATGSLAMQVRMKCRVIFCDYTLVKKVRR